VAISTACGGLDYILVETTAAAQACVDLLRRKNLGIATFMILVYTFLPYFDMFYLFTVQS
jgi:chromosome segregation ATPase